MPYAKRQQPNGLFKVVNTETESVKGSGMTEQTADRQLNLLNAVEHNPEFKPRSTPTHRHPAK